MAYAWFVVAIQRVNPTETVTRGEPDTLRIIGPFLNGEDAADYGATHCSPGGPDDPRWNSCLLDTSALFKRANAEPPGPIYAVTIEAPGVFDKGAYNDRNR